MTTLQHLRMARGLTQRRLAAELGVDVALLSRVESGWFTRPPSRIVERIRGYFGQPWTWEQLMQPVPAPQPDGATNADTN